MKKKIKNPKSSQFNNRQIFFLRNLNDNFQSFNELSKKTGFSSEEIELLVLDFIEWQNFLNREYGYDLEFIKVSKFPNLFRVKIGKAGKSLLLFEDEDDNKKYKNFKNEISIDLDKYKIFEKELDYDSNYFDKFEKLPISDYLTKISKKK